jgi:hypothetical protein
MRIHPFGGGLAATVAFGVLMSIGGCAPQPYVQGYAYDPKPNIVEVYHRVGTTEQTPLTVLASILGVHRADARRNIPYSVVVRLRLENSGQSLVSFDPATLELVTGTLKAFPPPQLRPPEVISLSSGQRRDVMAYFPFPPNATAHDMDLNHLRLRWEVKVDNVAVPQTALFQRSATYYDEDAYDAEVY